MEPWNAIAKTKRRNAFYIIVLKAMAYRFIGRYVYFLNNGAICKGLEFAFFIGGSVPDLGAFS